MWSTAVSSLCDLRESVLVNAAEKADKHGNWIAEGDLMSPSDNPCIPSSFCVNNFRVGRHVVGNVDIAVGADVVALKHHYH